MNLNFYPKTTVTPASLRESFVCCLVAGILFANGLQAQSANALHFDGINDNVAVAVKPSLNVVNTITIEAWIKPSKNTGVQDVISKSSASANNGYIFPRTTNGWSTIELVLNFSSGGWKTLRIPYGTNKIGEWHHVAATYDGFTMRIYIDGVESGSLNFTGTITVNNNNLTLGNQPGLSEFYGGSVDDARIYNRALSACEIAGSINCELAGTENGLVAYYKFNQGTAEIPNTLETILQDASASGANGTLTNFGLTGATSNWVTGSTSLSPTVCDAVVPTTVTAGSLQALVPVGGTINLTAESVAGATYAWTGPNNFTSSLQNPSIQNANGNASGTYTVTATVNGCAGSASIVITVAPRASGLNFDGIDDYISTVYNAKLNSDAFSVEAWVFPTDVNITNQNVISNCDVYNSTGFKFPKTNDRWTSFSFELSVDHEMKELSANFPTSAINKWNHLAATFDGYFMRIYLNGILVGTREITGTYTKSNKNLIIGNNDDRSEFFKGTVDEVRVWGRAISQCEIINNMKTCELNGDNNGLANQVALSAYYRFNQGLINVDNSAYPTLTDSSGNNATGTLNNFTLSGAASNWVTGKVSGVCDYFQLPFLSASANGSVFQSGSTAKLFAVYGNNDVYNWTGPNSFATSTQNPVLNNVQEINAGTYTVSTPYTNCEVFASTRIKVSDLPQIIAAGPTSFCPSGSVSLSSPLTGTSYQWYKNDVLINGATSNTYVATQSGNYSISVTSGTEVIVLPSLTVTVLSDITAPVANVAVLPTLNLVAPATVTTVPTATDDCRGAVNGTSTSQLSFTHSGTYTIVWNYNDGNGNISTQTQTAIVAHPVDVTAPVLTMPENITVAANEETCNAVVTFAATATEESEDPTVTITYSQNPGTSFPIGTTIVNVTATDAAGNASTGSFTVTVTGSAVAPITGSTIVCAGSTVTLSTETTGGTWNSANAAIATVNAAGVVTGVSAGDVTIIYTNSCGITASATVTVNAVPPAPTIMVVNNCGSTVLTVLDSIGMINWNTGATSSSITVSNAGIYTATQMVNGCVSAAAENTAAPKEIPTAPTVTVADNCGTSLLTVSNTTGSILWSNDATTASITVSNSAVYSVTQTVNGCISAAAQGTSAPKEVPPAPTIVVVNNCGTATLTASNTSGSILWNNGATTASINVSAAGTYTVTQTVNGCVSTAAEGIAAPKEMQVAPVITVTKNCGATTLSSNINGLWSNNATGISITVTTNGTYTQTVTNAAGCSASATATISVNAYPVVSEITGNTSVIAGTTTQLSSATAGGVWSSNSTNATVNASGLVTGVTAGTATITYTVTSAAGCSTAVSMVVTVICTPPMFTGTVSNITINAASAQCAAQATYSVAVSGTTPTLTYTFSGATNGSGNGTGSGAMFNIGTTTVTINAVNNCGTVSTSFSVTVKDVTAPVAATKNITIALDASGNATVTPAQVDNGSADNCSAVTLTLVTTNTDGTLSFNCSKKGANTVTLNVTDAAGNMSTQTAIVTVVDNTRPTVTAVPAQVFCGSAGSYTVPVLVSNDNCAVTSVTYSITGATNRTGTGNNASGTFNMGASTITWTVKDAENNITTSTTSVTLGSVPVASIAATSEAADFCSERVLTGSSSISGTITYKWLYGGNIVGTANQFSLGQASAEGAYQLIVTANGCASNPASYAFDKQTMLSSYTILATNAAVLGKNNKVASGSVGVTSLILGSATFKGNTAVNGANSFVKALLILKNSSDTIARSINGTAYVTGTPAMQYNTSNANSYTNYTTDQNTTVTLTGNYKTLLIRKGTYATLTGTAFGTVDLEAGASVRFTNTTINIDRLLVDDGLGDGNYSYVRFAPNASVRVSTQVSIGSQVRVNPDNYNVTFFMGDNWIDTERFIVRGADTKLIANIIMPNGKLLVTSTDCDDDSHSNCSHLSHTASNCTHINHNHKACNHNAHNASDCNDDVYMTGTFIVAYAESKGNTVIWNSYQCGSAPVTVTMSTPITSVNKSLTPENAATTTEDELKITVMPNPSSTYFLLKFESRYETPVDMRVLDANGRVVDVKNKIGSNSTIKVGENYASGIYYAEMIQATKRRVIQLIKVRG